MTPLPLYPKGHAFTCYLDEGMQQDLRALKRVSGESMSRLICKAIRMLMLDRVRSVKPTTLDGERLLERYGRSKE